MKKLFTQTLNAGTPTEIPPTHHVLVIDCSGSMSYDLPKIRLQLRNKLPQLLRAGDIISLVWFSGRGEFGRLVDRIEVQDLPQLQKLQEAVDRWLQPIGCTGFVEPLQSVQDLLVPGKKHDNHVVSLMFLTDGCDNEWSKAQILKASSDLAELVQAATFVEYGFYCNHALLEEMAQTLSGQVVFAEDFSVYDPVFEQILREGAPAKKTLVTLEGNPLLGFVWATGENGPQVFKVNDGKVLVPENTHAIHFWVDQEAGQEEPDWKALYQGLSVLALRRQSQFVKEVLAGTGDIRLWNAYRNAFGKQNTYDCSGLFLKASLQPEARFQEGRASDLKDDPNAFTLLDLVSLLKTSGISVNLRHMKYNRVGRASRNATADLTPEEKAALQAEMAACTNGKELEAVLEKGKALAAAKQPLTFHGKDDLQTISGLVWNESRANLSLRFLIHGEVTLPQDRPADLPEVFPTFVWRNYTLVRDGILNLSTLPVVPSEEAWETLAKEGLVQGTFQPGKEVELNLRNLPIINQSDIRKVTAKEFLGTHLHLLEEKAIKKAVLHCIEEIQPKEKAALLKEVYGEDAALYLEGKGVTDAGYAPKRELLPGKDQYLATELICKVKGLTVPSVAALQKKLDKGSKLNAGDLLLQKALQEVRGILGGSTEEDLKVLLQRKAEVEKEILRLEKELAEIRFSIIVGQTWFEGEDPENTHLEDGDLTADLVLQDTTQII